MQSLTFMMMAMSVSMAEERPSSVGYIDSDIRPLRCHWEAAEDAGICDQIIPGIEQAWSTQVDDMGWPKPVPDDDGLLDVYVSSDAGGYAYTQGEVAGASADAGETGMSAFIVFDPSFETTISWTMLHEFNHVLQFGIDPAETNAVAWEGTATAMEWWSDRSLVPQDVYIEDFQADPWMGLMGNGYEFGVSSLYEYGGALWLFHLDNRTGDGFGSAALDLWLDNEQEGWDNEPDFLDAVGTAFDAKWQNGWMDFAVSRIAVGTEAVPAWASYWSDERFGIRLEESIDVSALPLSVTPDVMPLQTGAVYFELTGLTRGQRIRLAAVGERSVDWAVFGFQNGYGDWRSGGTIELTAEGSSFIFGAVNLGAGDFDADMLPEAASLSLEVRVVGASTADVDEDKAGGCSTVRNNRLTPGLAFFGLFLVGVAGFRRWD